MVASWVGPLAPHQFAQRHQARRDDAVEGSLHLGVAEVERGLRGIDLRLENRIIVVFQLLDK